MSALERNINLLNRSEVEFDCKCLDRRLLTTGLIAISVTESAQYKGTILSCYWIYIRMDRLNKQVALLLYGWQSTSFEYTSPL